MAGFIALLAVFVLAVIVALVFIVTKLEQCKAEHRREMEDLVRGRTGRPANAPNPDPDAPQFGGVSSVFTTTPGSTRPTSRSGADAADTAAIIQQLQAITATAKGNAPTKAGDAAGLRRAQQVYEEAVAEAVEFNRGTKARQPGPCTLQINYVDADGVWTTRNVAPYKSGNTNERFDAWCETRQSRRTFFFERIQSAVDLTAGLSLTRAGVFQRIHPGRRVPDDLHA